MRAADSEELLRHIAMPVFPLERLQFLEPLFPSRSKIDAPIEADLVKLLDFGLCQQVPFLALRIRSTQDASHRFFGPLAGHTAVAMLFPVIRQGRKSLMPLVLPRLLGPLTVEPPSCLLLSHSHIFFASTGS